MKAVEFIKNLSKKDGVVIIFNNDGDGICSCALLMKYMKSSGLGDPYIINQPMPVDKNIIKRIQTSLPNKIIFLDIAIDQQWDIIKKLGGISDILVVDHHQIHKDLNTHGSQSNTVVHHNPRLKSPKIYQSTTYLMYKLVSEIGNFSDSVWIAAVGMISDYNLEDSKDVVDEIRKKYSLTEKKLYDTFLGRMADMIASANTTKAMSCEQIVHSLVKSETPEDFKTPALTEAYKEVQNEMSLLENDFAANSEKHGNLIFYEIKSKYKLASSLSTKVSEKQPKKAVIIYEFRGAKVKVSSRNQSMEIDVGRLLGEACKNIKNASGGGHEAAAGATVPLANWEEFKEKAIALANK